MVVEEPLFPGTAGEPGWEAIPADKSRRLPGVSALAGQ